MVQYALRILSQPQFSSDYPTFPTLHNPYLELIFIVRSCACADNTSSEAADLRKACRLNLASCYLNIGRNRDAATLCSDVLDGESNNRKALYRRGQAYAAMGDAKRAVPDLEAALAASPDGEKEAIKAKLDAARKLASTQGDDVVEEIEEVRKVRKTDGVMVCECLYGWGRTR